MEFEVEVRTLQEAKERIAALRSTFGSDVFVKINWVSGDKSRSATPDEVAKKLASEIIEQIRKKAEK